MHRHSEAQCVGAGTFCEVFLAQRDAQGRQVDVWTNVGVFSLVANTHTEEWINVPQATTQRPRFVCGRGDSVGALLAGGQPHSPPLEFVAPAGHPTQPCATVAYAIDPLRDQRSAENLKEAQRTS